uniref:helix-turn-helix domain-containing protein n=1 Tax=Pseudomonas viridiflava TaxID=33069 RepID=UPI003C12F9F0
MNIRPIHTAQDYKDALKSVSSLFDNEPNPGTPEGDYFDVMIILIEAYEAKHFAVNLPSPIDAIRFRMEQS